MPRSLLAEDVISIAQEHNSQPIDCLIIGGGSAGLTVAGTVADADPFLKVVVLEAGPAAFLTHVTNTEIRFTQALSDNLRDQTAYGPRLPDGKLFGPNYSCLGGRGLFWNGAAPRFRAHDFTHWPLSATELADDYAWAEEQFRVTTHMGQTPLGQQIIDLLRTEGLTAEAGPYAVDASPERPGHLGAGIASGLAVFFRRSGQALASGQVRLCTRTPVRQINLDAHTELITVEAGSNDHTAALTARSVVLAGGAFESVRLAMISKIPDRSGRLGSGLQEHHFYRCRFDAPHLYQPQPDTAVVYAPSTSQDSEQWELHAPGRTLFTVGEGSPWKPEVGDRYQIMMRSFSATDKDADNYLTPDAPAPHRGTPLGASTINFRHTARDVARREAMQAAAVRISKALGMVSGEPVADAARFLPTGSSYHEAGGLDMGTDSTSSVTDIDGRFHGVGELISADAASFPRIGATNPHLTIVALAHRKARALAARLLGG